MYNINIFAHVYFNSIDSLKHNIKNAPYVVRWGLRGSLDLAGSDAMALLMLRPLLLSTSICQMDHGGLDRGP